MVVSVDDAPRDCGELVFREGRGGRLRVEPRGPDGGRLDGWPERVAASDELLSACGATAGEEPGCLPLPAAAWDGERLTLRAENGQAVYAAVEHRPETGLRVLELVEGRLASAGARGW